MSAVTLGSLDLTAPPFVAMLGTSTGEWVPVTTVSQSLFTDGSVVTGDSTDNREINLKVFVEADSRAVLAQACEALVSELNAPSNLLTVTPDGGLPQVYETFRASQLQRDDDEALNSLRRVYVVSIPAKPFVRSAVREEASAAPPGVSVDDMEVAAGGVVMGQQIAGVNVPGAAATGGMTASASVAAVVRLVGVDVQGGALTATGGTVTDTTGGSNSNPVARVTTAAAGTVAVRSLAAFATSDAYITVDWAAVHSNGHDYVHRSYQAGIEWLNASNAVVRTDWGPTLAFNTGSQSTPRAISVASPRPTGATKARPMLRFTATDAGSTLDVYAVTVQPSTGGTVPVVSSPVHDGNGAVQVSTLTALDWTYTSGATFWERYATPYVYRSLPGALDLSGESTLRAWHMFTGRLLSPPSIRLWDAAGNWSRYDFPGALTAGAWLLLSAQLDSPDDSSAIPLDLTQVVGWDLTVALTATTNYSSASTLNAYVDSITAGPADAPNLSPRGTVLTLDGIKGSARTTASVVLTNSLSMSDWLVACIDGTHGDPLLTVAANKAAGSGYGGDWPATYSVIGCVTPAAALANPTCTVVQKVGGTTVATQVLTGFQQAGNRYVDFGQVALPLRDVPDENATVTYEFTLSPSSTAWSEVLVVDSSASFMWLPNLTAGKKVGFVDEPSPTAAMGRIFVGDAADRSDALAPTTAPVPGRPLHVSAPSTRLLVFSTAGAPSARALYWPRWLVEPTS